MAVELMGRIMRRPRAELDPGEKWVLTVMADRADDEGLLWYAVETIAELTSYTARGVQKIMDRLIAKGFVKKLQRRDRSNYYVIQVDKLPLAERKKRTKELGPSEFIAELGEGEPDLFGTGERRSEDGDLTGERRSSTGERRSGTGEPGSPNSLNDSLSDSLNPDAHARGGMESIESYIVRRWNGLAARFEALPPFRGAMSDSRRLSIEKRTKEWKSSTRALLHRPPAQYPDDYPQDPATALWDFVIDVVAGSKLLTGQKIDWAPDLDWILGPKNLRKIMEGNYGHGHDGIDAPAANERSAASAGSEARRLVERARSRPGSAAKGAGGHSQSLASAHR